MRQVPRLASLHPGVILDEVWQLTDFEFRAPAHILETLFLTTEDGRLPYGPLQEKLARVYPQFAARLHMT